MLAKLSAVVFAACASPHVGRAPIFAPPTEVAEVPPLPTRRIELTLTPGCSESERSIQVSEKIWWPLQEAPLPLITFRPGAFEWIQDLKVTPEGSLTAPPRAIAVRNEQLSIVAGGDEPVELNYRVGVGLDAPKSAAELEDHAFRHDDIGWSVELGELMMSPSISETALVTLHWGSPCTPEERVFSSYSRSKRLADGTITIEADLKHVVRSHLLTTTKSERHLDTAGAHPIELISVGPLPADLVTMATWIRGRLEILSHYFEDNSTEPIRVVLRSFDTYERHYDMLGTYAGGVFVDHHRNRWNTKLKWTLAHELTHRWIGTTLAFGGDDNRKGLWFREGFTHYFATLLLLDDPDINTSDSVKALNELTDELLTPVDRNLPETAVQRFPPFHKLSYARGALYAAELDGSLRAVGDSFDDLMRSLVRNARAERGALEDGEGKPWDLPEEAWEAEISRRLGPDGLNRYRDVIVNGGNPNPRSTLFGPCIVRQDEIRLLRDIDFDPASFLAMQVQGLQPNSSAAESGLLDGATIDRFEIKGGLVRMSVSGVGGARVVEYTPSLSQIARYRWAAKERNTTPCAPHRFSR